MNLLRRATDDGWERRFLADRARGEEAAALFRSLGYEVRLDPVEGSAIADDGCCSGCAASARGLVTVYTRKAKE
jgi:hypothetical protein